MILTNTTQNYYQIEEYGLPSLDQVEVPNAAYAASSSLADLINRLYAAGTVTVAGGPVGFPRDTGTGPAPSVSSVTAEDASVVVGGTEADPTLRTGTLDEIAALHAVGADLSVNAHKIIDLANGTDPDDAVAFGQVSPVWTKVVKQADESVASSTVLQLDDELKFTPVSGGIYEFELLAIYGSPAGAGTPDMKFTFAEDGTARGLAWYFYYSTTDAASNNQFTCATGSVPTVGTAATKRVVAVRGWYVGNGVETGLQWAQNTSGGNPTIVYAGSVLRYRRIS